MGDLSTNVLMGVKLRKDIDEALRLNSISARAKKNNLKLEAQGRGKLFIDSDKIGADANEATYTSTVQQEYPMKTITFTNLVEDDYIESSVWHLR